MFNDRNYLIIKVEEINKVDFSQVLETSSETVRKSVDEIYTFIKITIFREVESIYMQSISSA